MPNGTATQNVQQPASGSGRIAGALSDPIADMLTRIRNAVMSRHSNVRVPVSKIKIEIAKILHDEGYIRGFQLVAKGREMRIRLKYDENNEPVLRGLKRVSKPGRRVYVGHDELPRVLSGLGVAILSTDQGVMTAREAKRRRLGGEVLAYVW